MKLEIDKVYNCDCLELMRAMKEQKIKADCLLTDIPYGEVNRPNNGLYDFDKGNADVVTFDLQEYLEVAYEVVKGVYIIFCGTEQVSQIRKFFVDKGCTTRLLIWEKTNPSPMNGEHIYLSGLECAVYAKRGGGTFNAHCKNTVFRYPCGTTEYHKTQKPLPLWYELLRDNTDEGQLVLDTCMGSFTTAIACHKTQRHFIGAELDKENFDIGYERYNIVASQMSIFDLIDGTN